MIVISITDLTYYDEDAECVVDKSIMFIESCNMYAIIIAENDRIHENIERFEIIKHTYSYREAVDEYENYGGIMRV